MKDEPERRRMLSPEEEQERLAEPARQLATAAREMLRLRPSLLEHVEHSQDTTREAMSLLAEAFHILKRAPGVRPWDAERLYKYTFSAAGMGSSTNHAVRFVLDVWNRQTIDVLDEDNPYGELGHFECVSAMSDWDAGNRAAFATWVVDPWWP